MLVDNDDGYGRWMLHWVRGRWMWMMEAAAQIYLPRFFLHPTYPSTCPLQMRMQHVPKSAPTQAEIKQNSTKKDSMAMYVLPKKSSIP